MPNSRCATAPAIASKRRSGWKSAPMSRRAAGSASIPAHCRQVVDGALDADMVYVHARTPPVYGSAPLPQSGQAELCVRDGDFDIANARGCPVNQQARFYRRAAVRYAERADGQSGGRSRLRRRAGAARRHPAAADDRRLRRLSDRRRAGRQDASRAREISRPTASCRPTCAAKPEFFDALLAAAANPEGAGFSWCNDTKYTGDGGARRRRDGRDRHAAAGIAWRPGNACGRTCTAIRTGSTAMPRRSTATAAPSCAAMRRSPGAAMSRCARATASSNSPTTRIARRAA